MFADSWAVFGENEVFNGFTFFLESEFVDCSDVVDHTSYGAFESEVLSWSFFLASHIY